MNAIRCPAATRGDALSKFGSVHLRRDHVAEEHLDRAFVAGGEFQGFDSIAGFDHCIAVNLQKPGGEFTNPRFVSE